jgi:hypothetical protein
MIPVVDTAPLNILWKMDKSYLFVVYNDAESIIYYFIIVSGVDWVH